MKEGQREEGGKLESEFASKCSRTRSGVKVKVT